MSWAGRNNARIANRTNVFGIIGGPQPNAYSTTSRIAQHRNPGGGVTMNFLLWQREASPKEFSGRQIENSVDIQKKLLKRFNWLSTNPQMSGGVGKGAGTMRRWGNRAGYVK
jgi:hypothetical protein